METTNQNSAQWIGNILTVTSYYEGQPEADIVRLEKLPLDSPDARYFVCADGESYAMRSLDGNSCLNCVEKGLRLVGQTKRVYVTFALKAKGPSALKAWHAKWSKRTAPCTSAEAFWDASVRTLA